MNRTARPGIVAAGWAAMVLGAIAGCGSVALLRTLQSPLGALSVLPLLQTRAGRWYLTIVVLSGVPLAVLLLVSGLGLVRCRPFGRTAGLAFGAISLWVQILGIWLILGSVVGWRQRTQAPALSGSDLLRGAYLGVASALGLGTVLWFIWYLRRADRLSSFGTPVVVRRVSRAVVALTVALAMPAAVGGAGILLQATAASVGNAVSNSAIATAMVALVFLGAPLAFVALLLALWCAAFRSVSWGEAAATTFSVALACVGAGMAVLLAEWL